MDYEAQSKAALFKLAEARGLKLGQVNKADLIAALVADDEAKGATAATEPPPGPPKEDDASPPDDAKADEPDPALMAAAAEAARLQAEEFARLEAEEKALQAETETKARLEAEERAAEEKAAAEELARKTQREMEAGEVLARQTKTIRGAETVKLKLVLDDPDLPLHLKTIINEELKFRASRENEAEQRARLRVGEVVRYTVTKGGRFVTKGGHITELQPGSVLTEKTHDLKEVERQGIELRVAERVVVKLDQLGQQVSRGE